MNSYQNNGANRPAQIMTGNIAADMITASLAHYKRFGRRVKIIKLSHRMWRIFKDYLKKELPDMPVDDAIDFKNVQIRKGSVFQIDSLKAELQKPLTVA